MSFAEGASRAWAGVYPETIAVNSQVFNTWGEFTFAGADTTYDVSREATMRGRAMSITGPGCVANMDQCVFGCPGVSGSGEAHLTTSLM